jgi:hypothetical protein
MDQKLSATDQKINAVKAASRAKDRHAVSTGPSSWAELNRANSLGASIAQHYRPTKKLGLAR